MKKTSKIKQLLTMAMVGMFVSFILVENAFGQALAFPGAEGYGRFASGGRGDGENGRVVEVTNLLDDTDNPPEGSFRWAVRQGTKQVYDSVLKVSYTKKLPLTVVFKVGGVISLKSELRVQRDNLTVAGQTAPGDGICFRGATLNFGGSKNVIVRYIRSRPGDELGLETSAFRIENGSKYIIDHCSFSWAIEETTHFSSSENLTVQWCIISESLYNSFHKKGARGYGTQWGGQYASYHHNLLAHHNSRMPRINGSNENDKEALVDYRNNVNFNWGSTGAFYGGEWMKTGGLGFAHTNVTNNYFVPGPGTSSSVVFARPSRGDTSYPGYSKWYFNGNFMKGYPAMTNDNWLGVDDANVNKDSIRSDIEHVKTDGVLEQYDNYTQTAEEAYASILDDVGATLPKRDVHDVRLLKELTGEIGIVRYEYVDGDFSSPVKGVGSGLIDTQNNLVSPEDRALGKTAWDVYTTTPADQAPVDTDHDGIPDAWETEQGLNPNDITDGRLISDSGYSNLELFLNGMTGVTTSVKGIKENSASVTFYPQPMTNVLKYKTDYPVSRIEILDMQGKLVKVENLSKSNDGVDVSNLANGIYAVKVTFDDGIVVVKKVVKE